MEIQHFHQKRRRYNASRYDYPRTPRGPSRLTLLFASSRVRGKNLLFSYHSADRDHVPRHGHLGCPPDQEHSSNSNYVLGRNNNVIIFDDFRAFDGQDIESYGC